MSSMFSPDEKITLSGKGSIEQPIMGHGELYLTNKRLFLVHKTGLISKRETPLLDVEIGQITYCKSEGTLRKVLIVGVRGSAGQVLAYKIHVSGPDAWVAQIYNLKGGGAGPSAQTLSQQSQPWQQAVTDPVSRTTSNNKFCKYCGKQMSLDSVFCPACGKQQ
ncbi:MAG: zinc ribbon domain-containing protein [Thermoprotei archaeon]